MMAVTMGVTVIVQKQLKICMSDWSVKAMTKEVSDYFREQYGKASFRVVPGHWPDFATKEEVDKWLKMVQAMGDFFIDKYNQERESNDS
jgi:hypothetical protein